MYGGDGGFFEFRWEFILWTKVDLPAPAIPIVMMTMGFFFSEGALEGPGSAMMSMVVVEGQVNFAISMRAFLVILAHARYSALYPNHHGPCTVVRLLLSLIFGW